MHVFQSISHLIFLPNIATFKMNGKPYHYFAHDYNMTWSNERAIEVPIIKEYLDDELIRNPKAEILEIGNVLSNYFNIQHAVLDKYEKSPGVINEDIVTYKPKKKFDLIISISTLEHVGWDESPRKSNKTLKTIRQVKSLLKRGGRAIFTVPLGYNLDFDNLLKHDKLDFSEKYYLKKTSIFNTWKEMDSNIVYGAKYGWPFAYANEILIAVVSA